LGPTFDSPEKYLDGSPLDAAIWGFLMVAGLVVLAARQARVAKFVQANGTILLFLVYCALSTLWSDYSFVAFKRWTKEVGDLVVVLIVLTDKEPTAALRRLLASAAFLLLPISVLFIKYYPTLGRSYNLWNWEPMYGGITTNKNELGMICLVYGLGCLWCFLTAYKEKKGRERTRRMIAHGAILIIALWLLVVANSMTSLASFVLAGGLMVVTTLYRVARKPASVQLLLMIAVGCTVSALFLGIGGGALKMMGRNSTLTGRTDIWNIVLSLAGNPFWGTGFESFWLGDRLQSVWRDYGLHIQEAHNGYLEVYLNLGWIGVALLGALIVMAYLNVMRALREKQETSSLMLSFLLAAVLYSFTEAGFRMMSPIWTAFLLVATSVPKGLVPNVSISDRLPAPEDEGTLISSPYEPEFDPVTSLVPEEDNF